MGCSIHRASRPRRRAFLDIGDIDDFKALDPTAPRRADVGFLEAEPNVALPGQHARLGCEARWLARIRGRYQNGASGVSCDRASHY